MLLVYAGVYRCFWHRLCVLCFWMEGCWCTAYRWLLSNHPYHNSSHLKCSPWKSTSAHHNVVQLEAVSSPRSSAGDGSHLHPRQLCSSKPCASPQPLGDCELQLGLLCTLSVHWIWKSANLLCQCRSVNHPVADKFWHIWAFIPTTGSVHFYHSITHWSLSNSYFVYISIMVGECKFGCKTQFLQKVLFANGWSLSCML